MPRAGLNRAEVIAAGAALADEVGFANLALSPLAQRLGVRTPSLYKHVESLADLQHGIAVLALTELDARIRDAMHGHSGSAALAAFADGFRGYIVEHPGRYAATVGVEPAGPDDPLGQPSSRLLESMAAVLRGYSIPEDDTIHAMRTLRSTFHGFATLQSGGGFQWDGEPDASFAWMVRFLDRGLLQLGETSTGA
ncbi:TetR/AcrR family transcriptional regulator [Nocardia sp. NPDC003693]